MNTVADEWIHNCCQMEPIVLFCSCSHWLFGVILSSSAASKSHPVDPGPDDELSYFICTHLQRCLRGESERQWLHLRNKTITNQHHSDLNGFQPFYCLFFFLSQWRIVSGAVSYYTGRKMIWGHQGHKLNILDKVWSKNKLVIFFFCKFSSIYTFLY